ncbi:translesion DNA synthesis-associated protein ImuA [Undibacterium rugosum]|uniref:Translesion DNA synthesis-associated protein ImuA n=1 Tax=Undibacterium rugosum TaxID=2762291 RepID=A0A923I210_9BURK|nr:translesion DNA synthesis-associated protein ImuA [Undibacterium rugosum]MBC3935597.1 translesion DNA synthesis-associated protein ImuA [Undibacterium rugosum]MBR7778994.1 translesion DNA synthesis-associated protein ImuA [Undibacterium rugosum]
MSTLEHLHPALWRATQLAHGDLATTDTGYAVLRTELPGGGWPLGRMTEILSEPGSAAEMRLLLPALSQIHSGPIALLNPPHIPQIAAFTAQQIPAQRLLWLPTQTHQDSLWAAEQIIRHGSCAALLFWQATIRPEALRRLHLLAQQTQMAFFMLRPENTASNPSPALLRVQVHSVSYGLQVRILKRRGAQSLASLPLYLPQHPYLAGLSHDRTQGLPQDVVRSNRAMHGIVQP